MTRCMIFKYKLQSGQGFLHVFSKQSSLVLIRVDSS